VNERYKQLNSNTEAVAESKRLIDEASDKDGFMVAVWSLSEGKIVYHGKVTRSFPQADYLHTAQQLLTDCCTEVVESQAPPTPLPPADLSKLLPPKVGL